jgi:mannose-6-phosphate isomerase-like protein (cupin superfamily)
VPALAIDPPRRYALSSSVRIASAGRILGYHDIAAAQLKSNLEGLSMRYNTATLALAIMTAFATGLVLSPSGNVARHIHPKTDEIQYIIEGSGSMWLGTERKEFKAGTLIINPKGTPHAGTIVTNGPVKTIAIKMPPQPRDDVAFVN